MAAPPTTKGGNVGSEKYRVERDHFALMDRLPRKLREQIAAAPYPFAAGEIVEYLGTLKASGWTEHQAVELISKRFSDMLKNRIAAEAQRLYGPEHPQAKED
jgi:hypothetical protein